MSNVLIVDDISENLYFLELILKNSGYGVTKATNGKEALELARKNLPVLIISDILMPIMDGFSLCRIWKQDPNLNTIPFIFYTATYTDPKDEQFALSLGANAFLIKPLEPDILMKHVNEVFKKQQMNQLNDGNNAQNNPNLTIEYNDILIRKLKDRLTQLENSNKILYTKDFALNSSAFGVALIDLAGKIIYANDSFAQLFELDKNEYLGNDLLTIFYNDITVNEMLSTVKEKGSWLGVWNKNPIKSIQIASSKIIDNQGFILGTMLYCVEKAMIKDIQ